MKQLLLLICLGFSLSAVAQISIDASDMPVAGDTLRYSTANVVGASINLNDTGTNKTWNFSSLTPVAQAVDAYKTALQVNPLYVLISLQAYGYKIGDTLPIPSGTLPISVKDLYSFFSKKSSPSRFVAEAFAANISGLPTAFNYSDEDEWYYFPLQYGNTNNSTFDLKMQLASIASFQQKGTRKTKVDGWGTIITPFYTTPTNCIRIRSEIDEVDSVKISIAPAFGLPRKTIDYKWLAKGEHYPAMWVTTTVVGGTETITAIRYRDKYRPLSVANIGSDIMVLKAYPNPAADIVTIDLPKEWTNYQIACFDMQSKLVAQSVNANRIDISNWAAGVYMARVISGDHTGYVWITKH
ncbi:MAG: T9SS type A sorting domain-containing protein [Flavipsychrobacter sp.]